MKTGSAFRTACGDTAVSHEAGRVAAADKLNKLCELHGASIPTAAPERFCWTSCLDIKTECKSDSFVFDLPEGCSQACEASIFDPPEVSQYSTVLKINKPSGTTLTVRADEDHVQQQFTTIFGAMTIEIPRACRGPLGKGKLGSCPITIGMIKLAGHNNVSFFGKAVSNIRLLNPEPIKGTISTIEDVSLFTVPAGTQLYVSADLEGKGRVGNVFTAPDGLVGAIKWLTREYVFIGNLSAPDGSSSALITITATLPNVPPVAVPGPDQTVECSSPKGTLVTLNGSASTDADGPSDIRRHAWTSALHGVLEGSSVQAKVPLGQTPFELNVEDRTGAVDTKVTRVNVVDTKAPEFKSIEARTDCLWPADNKMRLLRLGVEIGVCATDLCDANTSVKIIDAKVDGNPLIGFRPGKFGPDLGPPAVKFGGGAVCLRAQESGGTAPRKYHVRLEAKDDSGNVKRQWVEFWVPDAAHPPTGCHTGPLLKSSGPTKPYELTPPKEVAKNLEFPLSLASPCSDQLVRPWSVGNPNAREVVFAWHLAGTNQYGLDLVRRATPPDPGVKWFSTLPVNYPDTLSVYANGFLQASKTSSSELCQTPPQVEPPVEIFPIVSDTDPRCTADAQPVLFQCGVVIPPITPIPIDVGPKPIKPKPIKPIDIGGVE